MIISDEHLYPAARALVVATGKCSTSFLQRIFHTGYSRAAQLVDQLEENGVVGPQDGARPREVLVSSDELALIEEKEEEEAEKREFAVEDMFEYDSEDSDGEDELYEEAKEAVIAADKATTSYLQRRLRIGYSRAARLIDTLEERGVIGPADDNRVHAVLEPNEEEK